ncbi:integrase [Paraburkholderia acidisoli]|uniref:Integrase n=1 Tax=Paraburkholderia acidisoli TaxID=2571748 RepID=A0A7Z2GEV6_9BURK|nr:integrase [Paraburkholderia acidisoli]QGZ60522.1 integrase [Paraburkholderia acidisoli]
MSVAVLHFTPRAELRPQVNLEAFIALCRNSDVLGARGQFDKNVWDVGYLKGQNKVNRAVFSTLEASREDKPEPSLPHPFLDFAKATLIYLQDKRPVTSKGNRIAALRCLEAALREWSKGSRPTAVNPDVLDTAVELAKKQVSPTVAYRIAGQLEMIAELMNSNGFISLRHPWFHGMKKPQELGSRISKEALAARQEKLPSAAALRALAGIFHQATETPDLLVSSYTALMVCAPERINEVLRLQRNCIVEGESEFLGKLGVRWPGSKGFDDTTKWLPSEMAPVARQAVANLLKVTASAQQIATWYTANPGKLYLHEGAAHLRDQEVLTAEELGLVLWGDGTTKKSRNSASTWARTNQLAGVPLSGRRTGYRFADVERAVVAMLPATFPYVPGAPELLCEDAMALVKTHEVHSRKASYLCMFSCVDYSTILNRLGGRDDLTAISIFERFGYTEDDGSPIELASHSLRHYLNMLAQMGGLSSTEIAIFSGRKDVKQNRAYDHMSSDEVQAPISAALKAGFTSNLVAKGGRELILRSEFQGIGIVAAHTTEYGWCTHNFASEPCQMYRDCMNCEEQECVKGEKHKEANLRLLKGETEYLLGQAREALSDEEFGADNWVKHQSQTLERVNAMLSILEDPSVPLGARIRLDLANAPLISDANARPVNVLKNTERNVLP